MKDAALWRALLDRVVVEYRAALASDLVALACFGSVARGEARPESDLDLYAVTRSHVSVLLDSRLERVRRLRESEEYRQLAAKGYRPEPMPIFHTVEELRSHPWILLDIAHHGVVLFDPDGILATELEAVRRRQAVAEEVSAALERGRWNLAARRAQEVVELVVKGLLNEMGTEYPRVHDVVPTFVRTARQRGRTRGNCPDPAPQARDSLTPPRRGSSEARIP